MSHSTSGYHVTGTVGTFGAAAAAARLLQLSPIQTAHALGIGGTQAAGLYSARTGAMTKRFHAGRASQSGVIAAYLAQQGFTGSLEVLEAQFGGFMSTLQGQFAAETILNELGKRWETARVGLKLYASCASSHTIVDGVLGLRRRGLTADNLAKYDVLFLNYRNTPQGAKENDRVNIVVNYHGRPKDGLIFANDRDGNPSVTGDNWPNRVHQWIPCLDHPAAKATVSFTVVVPNRDRVVANGGLYGLDRLGATFWTYSERKPIPPYCMVIAVSEGAKVDDPYEGVRLSYFVPQKDRAYAPKGFSPASSAVSFFSKTIKLPVIIIKTHKK